MLGEWQDSMRKVKAPPQVKIHDIEVPQELGKAFQNVNIKEYTNGLVSFSK